MDIITKSSSVSPTATVTGLNSMFLMGAWYKIFSLETEIASDKTHVSLLQKNLNILNMEFKLFMASFDDNSDNDNDILNDILRKIEEQDEKIEQLERQLKSKS